MEWKRAALAVLLPPKAGLSRAPLGQPERSTRGIDHEPGIVIPEKNCTRCMARQMLWLWKLARRCEGNTMMKPQPEMTQEIKS